MNTHAIPPGSRRRTRAACLLPLAAVLGSLAVAAPASAAVTTSHVTTPADSSFFQFQSTYDMNWNQSDVSDPDITIAGTTDGTTGDQVDILCTYGDDYRNTTNGVAVNADGSFSTSVPTSNLTDQACVLRAVPSGNGFDAGSQTAQFAGPRVGAGEFTKYTLFGHLRDFYLASEPFGAEVEYDSVSDCGIDDTELRSTSLAYGNSSFSCGASLYNSDPFSGASEIQIDGVNAYTAEGIYGVNYYNSPSGPKDVPGRPDATFTQSQNAATGETSFTEVEPLVYCVDAAGIPEPKENNSSFNNQCDHFAPTGVTLTRTSQETRGGRTIAQHDSFASTSGDHALHLLYDNELGDSSSSRFGTKFPGQSEYHNYSTYGEQVALAPTAPATIFTKYDTSKPDGIDNPTGAITYDTAPSVATFNDPYHFTLTYDRTVTGAAPVSIGQTYTTSETDHEARIASQTAGPVLTITSPAAGAVTKSDTIAVTGTVTDQNAVQSLTVNGLPTSFNPDGGWSQTLTLSPGQNAITAVATDEGARSATVTRSVTYTPAASPATAGSPATPACIVPNVAGKTVADATRALEAAGCTAGNTTLQSAKLAKGRIVSQNQAAGKKVSPYYPVDLVLSTGPAGHVTLVTGSARLVGRRLTIQLRCPVGTGKVCSGTAKIRTLSGRKTTLGTRSFQAPAGKKRKVVFVLSKTAAKRIHKAHRVKAQVYIVARGDKGNSTTTKPKLSIKG